MCLRLLFLFSHNNFYEETPALYLKDNDVELLRTGKLPDSFYNFSYTIPVITVTN